MNKNPLLLSCVLLLAACLPLRAQITVGPAPQIRQYSGAVVQSSAAGQTTTGILNVEISPGGQVSAQMLLNGVKMYYYGFMTDPNKRSGTGYIRAADAQLQPLPSSIRIPIFANKAAVYGGALEVGGASVTFRGERGGLVVLD